MSPYQILSIAELAARDYPPRRDIVEGLLPSGSLTLFSAREKAGKSLLAADLAVCVACGEPFLDRAVIQGPVIVIQAEENPREIKDRYLTRLGGGTNYPLAFLELTGPSGQRLRFDEPECVIALEELVNREAPVLVIFDPLREFHEGKENDADAMAPILRPIRDLAHATDTAFLLLHHMSKSGGPRGSTAIFGGCDQGWEFVRPHEPQSGKELRGTLSVAGRFGPQGPLGIRLGGGLRWQQTIQEVTTSLSARAQVEELLQFVGMLGHTMTAEELAEDLDIPKKTVQNIMSQIRVSGNELVEVGSGRRDDPRRYAIRAA